MEEDDDDDDDYDDENIVLCRQTTHDNIKGACALHA